MRPCERETNKELNWRFTNELIFFVAKLNDASQIDKQSVIVSTCSSYFLIMLKTTTLPFIFHKSFVLIDNYCNLVKRILIDVVLTLRKKDLNEFTYNRKIFNTVLPILSNKINTEYIYIYI